MRFTFRQLELFAALPRYSTLRAAAVALHISESALSHAISTLETSVGEQLCVRRKAHGFELTQSGQSFARSARALIAAAEELSDDFSPRSELRGPIRIGCYSSIAADILPQVLAGFIAAHPRVQVSVEVGADDQLLPALAKGAVDVALVYAELLPPGLHQRTLYSTDVLAVLPAEHPRAGQSSIDLADLESEPLILLDSVPSTANTQRVFTERGVSPTVFLAVPQIELVRSLVGRGLGYSLLMSRPNATNVTPDGNRIVTIPLIPPAGQTDVVAVWPRDSSLNVRARAFVDHALQSFT